MSASLRNVGLKIDVPRKPTISKESTNTKVIRQKVIFIALGNALIGFCRSSCLSICWICKFRCCTRPTGCSVAARPTSSVPAKEKAAVTNTEQTPGKPLASAPGSCHSLAPQYSPYWPEDGPPPSTKTSAAMRNMAIVISLRHDDQNSSSANPHVPNTLRTKIITVKMVIHTAILTTP